MNLKNDEKLNEMKEQITRYYNRIRKIDRRITKRAIKLIKKQYNNYIILKRTYTEDYGEIVSEDNEIEIEMISKEILPEEVEKLVSGFKFAIIKNYRIEDFTNVPEDSPRFVTVFKKDENNHFQFIKSYNL